MGVQAARSSTTARPFMRLRPQNIAVQVPANPADAAVSLPMVHCHTWRYHIIGDIT